MGKYVEAATVEAPEARSVVWEDEPLGASVSRAAGRLRLPVARSARHCAENPSLRVPNTEYGNIQFSKI